MIKKNINIYNLYIILLFCLFFLLLFPDPGINQRSSRGSKSIQTEVRPYSFSRKTRGYYEIKGARIIKEDFDAKDKITQRRIYTKGNKLYEKTLFVYEKGKMSEKKNYGNKNTLQTFSKIQSKRGGVSELVYNGKGELLYYYTYHFNSKGQVSEKRKYSDKKKLKQKTFFYYNKAELLKARLVKGADGSDYHLSTYDYESFDSRGNWTKRKEVQSYSGINYASPKEVLIRTVNNVKNSTSNPNNDYADYPEPSFSVKNFFNLTRTLSRNGTPGGKVLGKALQKIIAKTIIKGNCYNWINMVYNECGYKGKKRKRVYWSKESGPYADAALLKPGDWIMFKNLTYGEIGHSGIFLDWIDFQKRSAIVIGYAGENRTMPGRFREYEITQLFGVLRGE